MARIFHQNMRVYGGNSAPRNALYRQLFAEINADIGNDLIVAGFTEVMNSGTAVHYTLPRLAQRLDAGLTNFLVIEVGTTSVGARREFIAIATRPADFRVTDAGHVLFNSARGKWEIFNLAAAAIVNNRINIQAGLLLQADSRGVAYVAGNYGGTPYVIGFMHNMFHEGNKTGAFEKLGSVKARMQESIRGYGNATVVIGGDFNLEPRNPNARAGLLYTRCHRNGGIPVNTTGHNPYDFFVVSDLTLGDGDVHHHVETRVLPLGSDHCGITLDIH